MSAPHDLRGEQLLQWARARLMAAAEESVDASDRIAAARALVSSAHAELEYLDRQRAREEHIPTLPTLESLSPPEQLRLLEQAHDRIEAHLRALRPALPPHDE